MEQEMQVVSGHASFATSLKVQTVPAGSAVVSVNAAFNGKSHKNVVQKLKGYPAMQAFQCKHFNVQKKEEKAGLKIVA